MWTKLHFQPIEAVSRYRDPQLVVTKIYLNLQNLSQNVYDCRRFETYSIFKNFIYSMRSLRYKKTIIKSTSVLQVLVRILQMYRRDVGLDDYWSCLCCVFYHVYIDSRLLWCRWYPANTKHLHDICTTSAQRLRRWADVVQISYKCFVAFHLAVSLL